MIKKLILSMAILLGFVIFGDNIYAANNKKVLVVYYSATGTTEGVAKIIAKETNADLVKLEPKIPYTEADLNYRDKNSRVIKEHENLDKVHVELKNAKINNFDSYDTVFIGYPIWWSEASWVIDDFIQKNDFTGKRVIAFTTSISTGSGESSKRLEKMAGTGRWLSGKRVSSSYSEKEVINWLKNFNLK
ncbi:flavodoxin [Fusobacterium simiae]|uniref:Flavodoxin n=1 Tax=Fusobacterium simiae TaxID=855 RepID=A0ABT4DKK7_FUSSI|nr:flavodoxin [Fusobacterium simiae]MCY7007906.1 flavodoxin [Fusobacterium simiae]